jgi:DNA-binding transcriptional MerR regulator
MWISELSRRTDVPVATIKYYLREGLLPPGESVGATRAVYDDGHVRRLRLIRALVRSGGLSLAAVRAVLQVLDEGTHGMHDLLGSAHQVLSPAVADPPPAARKRVDALVRSLGWQVYDDAPARDALATALDAIEAVGHDVGDDLLGTYAGAAEQIATAEVAALPEGDAVRAVERAVVFTALAEPVLLALRRLAQEHASAQRYGR